MHIALHKISFEKSHDYYSIVESLKAKQMQERDYEVIWERHHL